MSRSLEARLAKVEQTQQGRRETHEDRLERLSRLPPLTEAERIVQHARIEADAIAEHGSLSNAAAAARAKAGVTGDLLDRLIAFDLEYRTNGRGRHAFA